MVRKLSSSLLPGRSSELLSESEARLRRHYKGCQLRIRDTRSHPGGFEGTDELARFELVREQDHLFARAAELRDVLVRDAAELRHQRGGFLALAVGRKRDRADDGLDLVLAQIFCDRLLVERPRRLDGLLDELTGGA